jgi:NFU1 iron-sulfur cluster scaffold homolog, mitochondrial
MYTVFPEETPNPQSMKFVLNKKITDEPVAFTDATEAKASPLAEKLFGFPWMAGVFIGQDFITISKQEWVDWDVLTEPLRSLLEEHLNEGQPIFAEVSASSGQSSDSVITSDDPTTQKIMEIIEKEVRPAVAMDGGDIIFQRYENNIVYLRMKGSCSGCPSSTYTLKQGIETRLKESVPEIKEVVAV